ncbi:MAG: hypothetical protein AVDCRST_MAG68-4427, partial [uncultured Gemmatimonadetes bacterium]
ETRGPSPATEVAATKARSRPAATRPLCTSAGGGVRAGGLCALVAASLLARHEL